LTVVLSVPCFAQGRTIDEGAFIVTRKGAPSQTESFKISRLDNDRIQATGQINSGDERLSSSLVVDSLGTPISYLFLVKTRGATTQTILAATGGHRLSLSSSDNRSNESMKEFPLVAGKTLILDDLLAHQLYFVALGQHTGEIHLIQPRTGRRESGTLIGKGMEPVEIAGRSATATHYSLVSGSTAREFWVDAGGRVLVVEIPSAGVRAVREEMPR
jgi:hypothetical protein